MNRQNNTAELSALCDAAKLRQSENELSGLGADLSELIGLADSLSAAEPIQVDRGGVSLEALRKDCVTPYSETSALVCASPEQRDGMPRVPRVVEESQ